MALANVIYEGVIHVALYATYKVAGSILIRKPHYRKGVVEDPNLREIIVKLKLKPLR